MESSKQIRHFLLFQILKDIPRYFEEMGVDIIKSNEQCQGIVLNRQIIA